MSHDAAVNASTSQPPPPASASPRRRRPLRRRDARTVYTRHVGPNMTPMVDVVMVILVFFMASAAFLGPEWFLRTLVPQPAPVDAAANPADPGAGAQGSKSPQVDPLAMRSLRVVVSLRRAGDSQGSAASATVATSAKLSLVDAPLSRLGPALSALVAGASTADVEVLIQPEPGVPWADVTAASEAAVALGLRTGIDPR